MEQRRLSEKLNLETAKMHWSELQTFFARGVVIAVDKELDLLLVAEQIAADNAETVDAWMAGKQVAKVSDQQARDWLASDQPLWTLVIKPWVLVQPA